MLTDELGSNWREQFASFNDKPFAAAIHWTGNMSLLMLLLSLWLGDSVAYDLGSNNCSNNSNVYGVTYE